MRSLSPATVVDDASAFGVGSGVYDADEDDDDEDDEEDDADDGGGAGGRGSSTAGTTTALRGTASVTPMDLAEFLRCLSAVLRSSETATVDVVEFR